MKHIANVSKNQVPAKAASLLAKEHMIANIADSIGAANDLVDLWENFINKTGEEDG